MSYDPTGILLLFDLKTLRATLLPTMETVAAYVLSEFVLDPIGAGLSTQRDAVAPEDIRSEDMTGVRGVPVIAFSTQVFPWMLNGS